ncbi:MAG: type II toxin-antitoxin system HicA family toxin [Chloroflexia bacterium]|nr:type II toxin-antitoxin system HicA family toxin [Chloroflexia bacterium]
MNRRKLYDRVRNSQTNVRFSDLVRLVEAFGFVLDRQRGSHHVYT